MLHKEPRVITRVKKIEFQNIASQTIKVPIMTIGKYHKRSEREMCTMILLKIDAKVAPVAKLAKGLKRRLFLKKGTTTDCGILHAGEVNFYNKKIAPLLTEIKDMKINDMLAFYICKKKLVIYEKDWDPKNTDPEWIMLINVKINSKIYCKLKKSIRNKK